MPTDTRTSELVLNVLSKQDYDNIPNPDPNQLYLVPEDEEHKPICYPTTASDVKTTSMLVKSSVSDNGKMLTENGFVYNTSGNPTVSDTKVICDLGVGFFEKKLENLTMNTEYHIKSYGQNSSCIVYGSELVQRTISNPIPVEYQLVEYLESSGTQYINTNYQPNMSHIIEITLAFNVSTWSVAFGCISGSSGTQKRIFIVATNDNTIQISPSPDNNSTITVSFDSNFNTYKYTPTKIFFNYNEYNSSPDYATTMAYLFARNVNNVAAQYCSMKLSTFKVLDSNNQYIRRMYPVYRISDSKPGMYDIANGVFYTNQGTGEFTVGPDKEWDDN